MCIAPKQAECNWTLWLPACSDAGVTKHARRILLGVALSSIGGGLTFPLLVIYLGQVRGLGATIAGLVVAYTAVASLVVFPLVGMAADHFGPKPVLIVGLLSQALGVALIATVDSTPRAFMVTTIVAVGTATAWPSQSAFLGRVSDPGQRERVFGIQFMLLNLGLGVGGLVASVIVTVTDLRTFQILYAVDACTFLLYVAVLLIFLRGVGVGPVPRDEAEPAGVGGYREVLSDRLLRRVLIMAVVLLMSGYGALEVGLPIFITVLNGLSVKWIGVEFAVNTFTIVIAQAFVLKAIKGRSRSYLMVGVAAMWGLSWLMTGSSLLTSSTAALVLLLAAACVFALGETMWAPVAPSLVNDLAPARLRGRYNSSMSLVWSLSGILGPGIAGLMLGAGLNWEWIALLVAGCVVAAFMAVALHRRLTPALDGREVALTT